MHRRKLLQWGLGAIGVGLSPLAARADDDIIGASLDGKVPQAASVPAPTSVAATMRTMRGLRRREVIAKTTAPTMSDTR